MSLTPTSQTTPTSSPNWRQEFAGFSMEVSSRLAKLELLRQQLQTLEAQAADVEHKAETIVAGIDILNTTINATQAHLTSFIESAASELLSEIFGPDYRLILKTGVERGRPSITPMVATAAGEFSPRDELGGGVLDVASLGARFALWAVQGRGVPVFLLDEPGKFVDVSKTAEFGNALRELSHKLNLQIVMVTHKIGLDKLAGRCYGVEHDDCIAAARLLASDQ